MGSINIHERVKTIGKNAFWGCNSLTSITIPEMFQKNINEILEHVDLLQVKIIYI